MRPVVNSFRYGEISPKFGGRFDSELYSQGCERMVNMSVTRQGGVTRRPPMKRVGACAKSVILPFSLSRDVTFIVELSDGRMRVWRDGIGGMEPMTFSGLDHITAPWRASQLDGVRWAQYYDMMVFVHRDVKPRSLRYVSGAFTFGEFNVSTDLTRYSDGSDYFGQREDGYPSVVAVCQNRLYLANTYAEPHTVWISRPYSQEDGLSDFTTYDVVATEQEILSDPSLWPLKRKTDGDGNPVSDADGKPVYTDQYDFSDTSKLKTTVRHEDHVNTAGCAMKIQLASGRNDAVRWISCFDNIYIGTDSSEWMLPYTINPLEQSASKVSSYGSDGAGCDGLSDGLMFIGKGGSLEEISVSAQGRSVNDVTYTADHVTAPGVRSLVCMNSPSPMAFLVLNDGTLAACSYDRRYGLQGWSRWNTSGEIASLAVVDGQTHQRLFAVVSRNGSYGLEEFDFDATDGFLDGDSGYESYVVMNRFETMLDDGTTLFRNKTVTNVVMRCLDTGKVAVGYDGKHTQVSTKAVGSDDTRIPLCGGATKELRMKVAAVDDQSLNILAMAYEMEVA
jgi:hypothetical protein